MIADLRGDPATLERDTVQTSTGGSSRESSAMGESLTEQRRVSDEGLSIVKSVIREDICVSNCAHLDGT